MLHVAPELWLQSRFRSMVGQGYLAADLSSPTADVKMDVTDIQYPDESFDVIYCSHVLEHVPNDKKAMKEFHRVLKKDGWAMLLVPITSERTLEDSSVTTPEERLRVFGQKDHVRRYGPDFKDRLEEAGFRVEHIRSSQLLSQKEQKRMAINDQAFCDLYFCRRSSQTVNAHA